MPDPKTNPNEKVPRLFKTRWFARAAKKSRITDDELYKAIQQVLNGQADDLGGGVYKKRLNNNLERSIIVGKGQKYWVYVFLYAKKDRDNIQSDELTAFRELADLYEKKTNKEIQRELEIKELVEIFR
jgi:hypothetical protein